MTVCGSCAEQGRQAPAGGTARKFTVGCAGGTGRPIGQTSASFSTRCAVLDGEFRGDEPAHRLADEAKLTQLERIEQLDVVQHVVVDVVDRGIVGRRSEARMIRNDDAELASLQAGAKSKPVTVPAPCKNTSGGPLPASSTTVSMPLIFNVRRVN